MWPIWHRKELYFSGQKAVVCAADALAAKNSKGLHLKDGVRRWQYTMLLQAGAFFLTTVVSQVGGDAPWVGPPDAVINCEAKLQAQAVRFARATLSIHWNRTKTFQCGTSQAVRYRQGPGKIRWGAAPKTSCGLALALARFEHVVQEEAQRHLGRQVHAVKHAGTYNCREMAAYPGWVSEHSYANAIDISSFRLRNGQEIRIADYAKTNARGAFLRAIARRAYDEGIFSVVLTPAFDGRHRHHLHLDLARYRVDGTGN